MMKKNRAKIHYIVDIIIGVGFLLAAFSGIVFLFGGTGGYQGGRNPRFMTEMLFISRTVWKDLHKWSGIIMAVGVAMHFILHWSWLTRMTKNLFKRRRDDESKVEVCHTET